MLVKMTALVIDDSSVMRKMVMKSLAQAKLAEFEFVEAEDGEMALEQMKAHEIDIAFVDWNMPKMTGIEFVVEVRKQEKTAGDDNGIPLVMVTSEKTMGKIQTALDEAGADSFITKPFTVEELQVKLKKSVEKAYLVRRRKLRDKAEQAEVAEAAPVKRGWFG
jgi:two-component system chemotaxis response regulator CheY